MGNQLRHPEIKEPVKVYYFTPVRLDKNLGRAYNQYMDLVNDDDWVCMMDRDILFLRPDYHQTILNAITNNPDTGVFTCYCNRVGNKEQCYNNTPSKDPNIIYHRQIADEVHELNNGIVEDLERQFISGFLMIFQKSTWAQVGGFENDIFVDTTFTHKVYHKTRKRIKIIKDLYVFHYYRLKEGLRYMEHLLNR